MNKNKHIPQGYKDSPLGIIPKEWEVKRLGDIADITSGTTPLRSNSKYYNNGVIPWVKTTDLNNGTLYETEEKVSIEAVEKTSLKMLPKGTVLVAMYGGFRQIGRTALLGIDATINQALSALMCKSSVTSPFVLAWLNCRVNYWKRLAASSRKDPNITGNEVAKFPILIPSKEEQNSIVEVLELWDTTIEKQSKLIEKLKLRKRALMQQLLTGKKRLSGFNGEWKNLNLGVLQKLLVEGLQTLIFLITGTEEFLGLLRQKLAKQNMCQKAKRRFLLLGKIIVLRRYCQKELYYLHQEQLSEPRQFLP